MDYYCLHHNIFILSIINSSNSTQGEASFIETKLDIGIVDNSNSQLSNGLKERNIWEDKNNIVEGWARGEEAYKGADFLEIADAIIVIPEDFEGKGDKIRKSP